MSFSIASWDKERLLRGSQKTKYETKKINKQSQKEKDGANLTNL